MTQPTTKIKITVIEYKALKRAGVSDKAIANEICGASVQTLIRWKHENGLIGVTIRAVVKPAVEMVEPGKIAKLKKKYLEARANNWTDEYTAEYMGLNNYSFYEFKTMYFPQHKRKKATKYTPEQRARAKANGLTMDVVKRRIEKGMSEEEAYTTPLKTKFFTKDQMKRIHKKGIHRDTVRYRMEKMGMDFEKALKTPVDQGKSIGGKGNGNKKSSKRSV